MKKIKITPEQYNKIIIFEQEKKSLNESNEDILMGFSKLLGVRLTNKNLEMGERALNNNSTILKIKDMIENHNTLKEMIKKLQEKGMVNPSDKIKYNADKIINSLNKLLDEKGLKVYVSLDGSNNLKNL